MTNHVIDASSSILRLEFLTENHKSTFHHFIEQNKLEQITNKQKYVQI